MIYEKEFIRRLAWKGNPRWTKEGFEKKDWDTGNSKWNIQEAKEIFDAFIETLTDCLADGESVNFRGFGKFEIRETKPRYSVDLERGRILIPAHKRVHFTQGRLLRALVDKEDVSGES